MNRREIFRSTDPALRAQMEDLGPKATDYWKDFKTSQNWMARRIAKERTFDVVQQMLSKVR